nr:CoF synthetase [uncultured Psychroserpens sp.]
MKLLEDIRYYSFWILDLIKGGRIRAHYKNIKYILENYNSERSKIMRDKHLSNLLQHAVTNASFYKPYSGFNSISEFPVIDKLMLRNSLDDFIAKDYKNKKSFEASTSGSTGTPFVVFQDKNKKNRNAADTIYFGEQTGFKIGHKLYYIRAWGDIVKKAKLTSLLQNIVSVNVKYLNAENNAKLIADIKKGRSNKAFLGYPSAFKEICKYLDSINSEPIEANISSMVSGAEYLSDSTIASVKKYFGFDILSRYSNTENGILSQQIKNGGSNFYINWASYYIEIFDLEEDVPCEYGKLGRVIVTDLFNYHMPLIRYDTGDLAIMVEDDNSKYGAPTFSKVEGRRMDTIYDTKGNIMTTVVYELEYFPEFKQFQLIQDGQKEYRVKINIDGVFSKEEQMKTLLKSYLGEDAIIVVEYVDEVPQLASGKRKFTINNYRA